MERRVVWVVVVVLLPQLCYADGILDYEAINLSLKIQNSFDLVPKSNQYTIQKATADLSWVPQNDYRQSVERITNKPAAIMKDGAYSFTWINPREREFNLVQESLISTNSLPYEVRKKIKFPLQNVSSDFAEYLLPAEIIDMNSNISSLAAQLVAGEDDAFIVVSKLAGWVEANVKYDLSTTTADASQKASWVLENRVGVCDELTSLFISMSRSLGIPARFVSGISYSNVNLQNDGWGPHGWAEVYFPEVGWVPFDVTYKEWGYVDASHIKLKTSSDAKETSVEYRVTGSSVSIKPGGISFDVNILDYKESSNTDYELELDVAKDEVGFGSYNLVTVRVKNLKPYYIAGKIYISNVTELEIQGSTSASFVIGPGQEKDVHWVVRVSPDLDRRFIYTIPIRISSSHNEGVYESFQSQWRRSVYSENYVRSLIPKVVNTKQYSEMIEVVCSSSASEAFTMEDIAIDCSLYNGADKELSLRVCMDKNCSVVTPKSGTGMNFTNVIMFENPGIKTVVFSAESAWASKDAYVSFAITDKPNIMLRNLTYPASMSLDDFGEISFIVQRESVSNAKNVVLTLNHELLSKEWVFPSIENTYDIKYKFTGRDLLLGDNPMILSLSYEDSRGNMYAKEERFSVELSEDSAFGKFKAWLNGFDRKIDITLDVFAKSFNQIIN